jgi:dipeptidyl aminopeptidase/acylaminoacyl peptidase
MKVKSRQTRREFMEGALFAGAAFAFTRTVKGEQISGMMGGGDFGTPLLTERMPQPEGSFCILLGFSPVNDQAAFIAGTYDRMSLYVSKPGQPDSFDVRWRPNTDLAGIKAGAWSPNGSEIAFLVQAINETTPKTGKISIYIVDVSSGVVREPVVIVESDGAGEKQYVKASYKKGLFWWDDSSVCVPTDKAQDGPILKFDTHTGQSEVLAPAQNYAGVSKMTRISSGEMRFVKDNRTPLENTGRFILCTMLQDGSIREDINLTEKLGQISDITVNQQGDFVFAERGDIWTPESVTDVIYKIETQNIAAEIPRFVRYKKDMYSYKPLAVRNSSELILMESVSPAKDDGSIGTPQIRVVKKAL